MKEKREDVKRGRSMRASIDWKGGKKEIFQGLVQWKSTRSQNRRTRYISAERALKSRATLSHTKNGNTCGFPPSASAKPVPDPFQTCSSQELSTAALQTVTRSERRLPADERLIAFQFLLQKLAVRSRDSSDASGLQPASTAELKGRKRTSSSKRV